MIKLKNILNTIFESNVKKSDRVDIYRDSDYIVIRPLTHEASRKYGCDTNWCTSTSNKDHFNLHNNDNSFLIYIINRHKKPENLLKRHEKVQNFIDNYENLTDIEKNNYIDLSRIAISVENGEITMFDANDFNLSIDFGFYDIGDLPISGKIINIIKKYVVNKIISGKVK